jgi:hypothetical protein
LDGQIVRGGEVKNGEGGRGHSAEYRLGGGSRQSKRAQFQRLSVAHRSRPCLEKRHLSIDEKLFKTALTLYDNKYAKNQGPPHVGIRKIELRLEPVIEWFVSGRDVCFETILSCSGLPAEAPPLQIDQARTRGGTPESHRQAATSESSWLIA